MAALGMAAAVRCGSEHLPCTSSHSAREAAVCGQQTRLGVSQDFSKGWRGYAVHLAEQRRRAAWGNRVVCQAVSTVVDVEPKVAGARKVPVLPFRVGHGFDLHRLEPGYPLIIGGVTIPHERGCQAHSDGDVLLHCIVDAILGALGLPDIGQLFPDNDPKWKGAASSVFIKEAVRRMHEAGYELGNLDATIIAERPKLSTHKPAILANLVDLLDVDISVLNIKAKTHEKVDSLGENRSIAAHTVVLLMKK